MLVGEDDGVHSGREGSSRPARGVHRDRSAEAWQLRQAGYDLRREGNG